MMIIPIYRGTMVVHCVHVQGLHSRFLSAHRHHRFLSISSCLADKGESGAADKNKKYSHTILLPRKIFPPIIASTKIPQHEQSIQKTGGFGKSYYSWQQEQDRQREYVLHDGPPYANGVPHIGHSVNKIMKDITIRHKVLQGYKVQYIPGWDCHGLPIELKAKGSKDLNKDSGPLEIRRAARKVAEEFIGKQRTEFERWGVLADWHSKIYRTFDTTYIKKQLNLFAKLYDKGYIYQDYLPVHYSPHLGTTLAEAELEYDADHISTAIYLALRATSIPSSVQDLLKSHGVSKLHLPIWTTTPWTIPFNEAVAYASDINYFLVSVNLARQGMEAQKLALIWAEPLIDKLKEIIGGEVPEVDVICSIKDEQLAEMKYRHPIYEKECPLLCGNHVKATSGCGLVHIAPAHGHDDFALAIKKNIRVECFVDDKGKYMSEAGKELEGLEVLGEGNEAVLKMLEDKEDGAILLDKNDYKHSYPVDWRARKPVMIKATSQWFLDNVQLKEKALEALNEVKFIPTDEGNIGEVIKLAVQKRPYWCISRQRVWGTPIPVFYDSLTAKPITNREIIEHVAEVLGEKGSDAWWTLPEEDLLPPQFVKEAKDKGQPLPSKGKDTLDIWFDSGSSWFCVLDKHPADLYLEGLDQFNGWFLCSLFTSVALTGSAPYKCLYVHGFTVDKNNRKMSKSLGNVVDPRVITDGGKNKKRDPAYGADVLRWWVAARDSEFANSKIGPEILEISKKHVNSIRNNMKHVLGCLAVSGSGPNNYFDVEYHNIPITELRPLDRYILHLLYSHVNQVWRYYEDYKYYIVAFKTIGFINEILSALYFSSVNDRLYCEAKTGSKRTSVLCVLHHVLHHLVPSFAPILPHLAEEVTQYYHKENKNWCVFKEVVEMPPSSWHQPELSSAVKECLLVREEFNRKVTLMSTDNNPATLHITINARPKTLESLKVMQTSRNATDSDLCELFKVAQITINPHTDESDDTPGFSLEITKSQHDKCLRCRRFTAPSGSELCARCQHVLESGG